MMKSVAAHRGRGSRGGPGGGGDERDGGEPTEYLDETVQEQLVEDFRKEDDAMNEFMARLLVALLVVVLLGSVALVVRALLGTLRLPSMLVDVPCNGELPSWLPRSSLYPSPVVVMVLSILSTLLELAGAYWLMLRLARYLCAPAEVSRLPLHRNPLFVRLYLCVRSNCLVCILRRSSLGMP